VADLDTLLGIGGTADATDLAALKPIAARLPPQVVSFLVSKGAKIIVCRKSITDHAKDLAGVQPRGWPAGMTWDVVPGVYLPDRKQVVVATLPAVPSGRRLPATGEGHGSFNLLLHETMHGHDFLKNHGILKDRTFTTARTADYAKLGSYEQQAGDAGLQETYAESAARSFGHDATLPAGWPNLAQFWAQLPTTQLSMTPGMPAPEPPPRTVTPPGPDTPVGTASVAADGTITLDLRADAPGGAIGHALIHIAPDHPQHAAIAAHLTGGEGMAAPVLTPTSTPLVVKPFAP
jgi:hypothetical protein